MWFILSLACAFFTATAACLIKILIKNNDEFLIGWLRYLVCLPIFAVLYINAPKLPLTVDFWKNVSILMPLELAAFLIYLKSIKISPLSLTFPFLALTPVFSIITAYIFLGEIINFWGIVGIALIGLGAYLLNSNLIGKGVLEPLKKIYQEKGSILMVLVAFIFSITSTLGKKGVMLSSPVLFPLIYYPIFAVIYSLFIFYWVSKNKAGIKLNKINLILLILSAVAFTAGIMFHFSAIALIEAPYMISVKRLSLLFSVLYGAVIFKERCIKYRLIGASVMVMGVLILARW